MWTEEEADQFDIPVSVQLTCYLIRQRDLETLFCRGWDYLLFKVVLFRDERRHDVTCHLAYRWVLVLSGVMMKRLSKWWLQFNKHLKSMGLMWKSRVTNPTYIWLTLADPLQLIGLLYPSSHPGMSPEWDGLRTFGTPTGIAETYKAKWGHIYRSNMWSMVPGGFWNTRLCMMNYQQCARRKKGRKQTLTAHQFWDSVQIQIESTTPNQ